MSDEPANITQFPNAGASGASSGGASSGGPRPLPASGEAEENLLGALLVDNKLVEHVDDRLQANHFSDGVHAHIFSNITRMIDTGRRADAISLKHFMSAITDGPSEEAIKFLDALTDTVPTVAPEAVKIYATTIYETHVRRELVRIGDEISLDAHNPKVDTNATTQIETAEAMLFKLAEHGEKGKGLQDFAKVMDVAINQAAIAQKSDGHLTGISTGLTDLNNLMGGMHNSDLIILAGRPAMGKSALAATIAFHAATTTRTDEAAVPVAFFSLEMSAPQLGLRLLSRHARLDSNSIRRGLLSDEEFQRLYDCRSDLNHAPFYIDDTAAISVSQVASRARRMKRTTGLGLIVVDYLQMLAPQLGLRPENRVQEISNVSRQLKVIAMDLDVPVIALSQLSRAVEAREDKRPNLSDLRDSGSIEQDADVVLFLYREEYYLSNREPERREKESDEDFNKRYENHTKKQNEVANKAELIISKQRHGPTGTIDLHFEKRYTHFSDLDAHDRGYDDE